MSKGKDKAIFRSEKLRRGRGKSTLGNSWRHLENHDKVADILHPEISHMNYTKKWIDSYEKLTRFMKQSIKRHNEIVDAERAKMEAAGQTKNLPRRLRNDAAIACECIFTFSPEMAGKFDIKEWERANAMFIKREFVSKGAKPIRVDLHMDETTPHLHFVFCPITKEGKISAKEFLGGAKNLSMMQDRYAEAMEQFGLTRGYSRYSVYKAVQQEAIKEGYASNYEGVKAYCKAHHMPVPSRKHHQRKQEWLASLEQSIEELKEVKSQLEAEIKKAGEKLSAAQERELTKQLDSAKARIEYLEAFIDKKEIRPFWTDYISRHHEPTRAKTEDELFDEL